MKAYYSIIVPSGPPWFTGALRVRQLLDHVACCSLHVACCMLQAPPNRAGRRALSRHGSAYAQSHSPRDTARACAVTHCTVGKRGRLSISRHCTFSCCRHSAAFGGTAESASAAPAVAYVALASSCMVLRVRVSPASAGAVVGCRTTATTTVCRRMCHRARLTMLACCTRHISRCR
jgi:hypothetical protein